MDVLQHITELMKQRNWTLNHLAVQSGVPQSTLSGLYQRSNTPTIVTLEKLCEAFGITMSEFFSEGGSAVELTEEQRRLLDKWASLSERDREAVWALIEKL